MPSADRVARDAGDHRLGQAPYLPLQVAHVEPRDPVVSHIPALAPDPLIAARAEGMRTLARQDHHAYLAVVPHVRERCDHLLHRLWPERVPYLGSVDGHLRDALSALVVL